MFACGMSKILRASSISFLANSNLILKTREPAAGSVSSDGVFIMTVSSLSTVDMSSSDGQKYEPYEWRSINYGMREYDALKKIFAVITGNLLLYVTSNY
jgi:hypothetical protein